MATKFKIWILLLLAIQGCSKSIVSSDSASKILIDGNSGDWNKEYFQKVPNQNLIYAFAVQNERLEILFVGLDNDIVRKMIFMGVTIWLDGKGKKKKDQGIIYPNGMVDDLIYKRMMQRGNRKAGQGVCFNKRKKL